MTREGYNKHKEVFEAWLDGKQIQILGENGQWIDSLADIKWKEHKEYRIKPTKIEIEDCSFNEVEYITQTDATLLEVNSTKFEMSHRKGFIKNKKVAEAYAVLPQLIRLVDEYNEGWKPLCNKPIYDKHVIYVTYNGRITTDYLRNTQFLLTFNSRTIMLKFLEDHRDLIEIAKPLL